jgi:phosphate transport system permease protein
MNNRLLKDKIASYVMATLTFTSLLLVVAMAVGLYTKSSPILHTVPLTKLLFSPVWRPSEGEFGFLPFLAGTMGVTLLAVLLALPVSLFMAIHLTEYARKSVRKYIFPLLDILAGLPSVIYGVWGTLLVVPWISDVVAPALGVSGSGYCILAGGIVLGVMIIPLLVSLFIEIFGNVPMALRESSTALGATKWQTTKHVILRQTLPGIIASVVLAVSRTMGETIAVLMVCGNLPIIPTSLLDACYPIPALIANSYGEMMSVPMYESALMLAAFLLFFVVLVFNLCSRIVLRKIEKNA